VTRDSDVPGVLSQFGLISIQLHPIMSGDRLSKSKSSVLAIFSAGKAPARPTSPKRLRRRSRKKSAQTVETAPFALTDAEAMAAVLGLASAPGPANQADLGRIALAAIAKIVAASPSELQTELRRIVAEAVPPDLIDDFEDLLEILDDAIRDERKLRIAYLDQSGESSIRTIKPLARAESKSGESIAAWCELRRGFRHFRVDRIDGVTPLDSYFKGERDALLDQYLDREGA